MLRYIKEGVPLDVFCGYPSDIDKFYDFISNNEIAMGRIIKDCVSLRLKSKSTLMTELIKY